MADSIRHRRGKKSGLPLLRPGELGLCTDSREVFMGLEEGNLPILTLAAPTGGPLAIDEAPVAGSGNLVCSGGVHKAIADLGVIPVLQVSKVDKITTITVTDGSGVHIVRIYDGIDGLDIVPGEGNIDCGFF